MTSTGSRRGATDYHAVTIRVRIPTACRERNPIAKAGASAHLAPAFAFVSLGRGCGVRVNRAGWSRVREVKVKLDCAELVRYAYACVSCKSGK